MLFTAAISSTTSVRQFRPELQTGEGYQQSVRCPYSRGDDFADWRRFVVNKLLENRSLQVIGVASDGLAAVLKAEDLQPDLILLDIGLPKLDGIAAARHIRKVAPKSKILFLSQELDPDVARAALCTGGHGYVVKSYADSELFAAVEAVMLGKKFVSRRLEDHPGYNSMPAYFRIDKERRLVMSTIAGDPEVALLSSRTTRRTSVTPPRTTNCRTRTSQACSRA
jgi:DNA-binding NarL/FixJ family response regulator